MFRFSFFAFLILLLLYGMLLKLFNEATNGQEYLDIALFVSFNPKSQFHSIKCAFLKNSKNVSMLTPQFERFHEIAENLKRITENPILNQGVLIYGRNTLLLKHCHFFLLLQQSQSKACF